MATPFLMPKLGLTMEEGTISQWLVSDGSTVAADSVVLLIETDKTETEVETPSAGTLHILANVGDTYACGDQIGWLLADGEAVPNAPTSNAATTSGAAASAESPGAVAAAPAPVDGTAAGATANGTGRIVASPNARRVAAERGLSLAGVRGTGPGGRIVAADLDGVAAGPPGGRAGPVGVLSTFAARALADLLGVDISAVPPDPRTGRITKEGVGAHVRSLLSGSPVGNVAPVAAAASPAAPASTAALPAPLQQPSSIVPLKGMRGTIARRMHESLQQMAQLSLFMDADLDAVVADRATRKAAGAAPSYTDYVIAATARALREHPHVNAQVTDEGIALLPEVHVSVAVALDNGLIVPVVRNTLARDLTDLAAETSRLAEAARAGKLALNDLEGGTFSVSTLGPFGVDGFTPVINPPNAAILGVGRLRDDLVLGDDGQVTSVKRLTLSLTWDHRVFDGAPAAAFTRRIVELLADPGALDR